MSHCHGNYTHTHRLCKALWSLQLLVCLCMCVTLCVFFWALIIHWFPLCIFPFSLHESAQRWHIMQVLWGFSLCQVLHVLALLYGLCRYSYTEAETGEGESEFRQSKSNSMTEWVSEVWVRKDDEGGGGGQQREGKVKVGNCNRVKTKDDWVWVTDWEKRES